MRIQGFGKKTAAMGIMVIAVLMGGNAVTAVGAEAVDNDEVCKQTATLFRSARKVISDNQGLINDASKGDKGLTAEVVIEGAKKNYENATGGPLPEVEAGSLAAEAREGTFAAITKVMDDAQPLINEQGKGFKGFIPAVFAKGVADQFSAKMSGKMFIKLTAPKAYVRNRANRPDSWENDVIEKKFKAGDWKKGETYSEATTRKNKKAYRLIVPEYYGESCLKCHGEPKGETDVTGGKKEGAKLGELGGAVSVGIYTE